MLDKSGILNKDFMKLVNDAERILKKNENVARIALNNLPESESELKSKLTRLMKSSTTENANHEDLMKELNKIVDGRKD